MNTEMYNLRAETQVLLIDHDVELCHLLEQYLESEHFQVESVNDGDVALARARSGDHDIVLLEITLPGINGFEVLRQIRRDSELPVVILTARDHEVDRVVGLELGADDYLTKPVSPRELAARIRTILRRTQRRTDHNQPAAIQERISIGDISLDPSARTVTCSDRLIELTSAEFDLLELLLRSAGRAVSREQLCKNGLKRNLSAMDRGVDMHICRLRKKLGTSSNNYERIKTIRSIGYLYRYTGNEDVPLTLKTSPVQTPSRAGSALHLIQP